jgi:hypothetical protein
VTGLNLNYPLAYAQPQQMYTGKDDSDMIRRYSKIVGYEYLTAPRPFFDGKNVSI